MGLFPKQSDYRDYRFPSEHVYNRIYHVDSVNGSDTYSGLSWKKAKATIMAAVNLARYLPGTTTIDDTKDHKSLVLVAPGQYNGEDFWFSGYGIEIVGCGHGRPGKDYGVSINYDAAQDTNAVIAFSGSGITLRNLFITCEEAIPGIWCSAGDNNLIENCVISSDGTMTYGMNLAGMKGSEVRDCVINGFATGGILVAGGADIYAIEGGIYDCKIHGDAGFGIKVESTVTARGDFDISRNRVDVLGGGAGSIGIDVDFTGILFVTDNRVRAHTTAIDHEGEGALWNHCSQGAAGSAAYALIDEDDM